MVKTQLGGARCRIVLVHRSSILSPSLLSPSLIPPPILVLTLRSRLDALVPGGVLCLTAGTPWAKFVPGASGMCPIQAVAQSLWEANQGKDWPGSQGVNHQELMAGASLFNMPNDQLPTYLHPIAAEDLSRACERAGFEVLLKREQIPPGWPPASANIGRENAQVVARKVVRA
mgnify:CR=1 FL=1